MAAPRSSFGTLAGYKLLGNHFLSNDRSLCLLKEYAGSKILLLCLGIYAVVVNPLMEELFWRGVVLNYLDRSKIGSKKFAVAWSSSGYAALHYPIFRLVLFSPWAEILTAGHVLYGVLLCWIYRRSGSIVTTAVTHGLLTDTAFIVVCLELFRHHPEFLNKLP
ncbi:MAG TPA: CPBP family intramembrane glutamic endopeptidase [Chroococcales cyanobacterium]